MDLVVLDEAHHVKSASWMRVLELFPQAQILGLSASPERSDGSPLGDVFEKLVVAASYSELLADGYLSPCRVFRPTKSIENGIALDPVRAYLRYTPGMRGFCFVSTVKQAAELNERFNAAGVKADVLHGFTHKDDRKRLIADLDAGRLDMLINCTSLTEGVNIPSAQVCILARRCAHSGLYIQTTGRVLRRSPGKDFGVLLDLVGASSRHGLPTDDRQYALTGTAIRISKAIALRQCYLCGAVMAASARLCITCHVPFTPGVHRPPKIHNLDLAEVYNGSETPDPAKQAELVRLCTKGSWPAAAKQYERLFGHRPAMAAWALVPHELVLTEYKRLLKLRSAGQASAIMKAYTGAYPTRWKP